MVWPYPAGKHDGMTGLYWQFDECMQGRLHAPGCIKEIFAWVHTMGIAEELYLPVTPNSRGQEHSTKLLAWVCDTATMSQCGIVAAGQISFFGECHARYKDSYCEALEGGVRYPDAYHVVQPPYSAYQRSQGSQDPNAPVGLLWSSLTNSLMWSVLDPDPNNLIQLTFAELVFESVNPDPALAGDPDHDVVHCASSDDGCRVKEFGLYTVKLLIEDYTERPFSGFTDRDGNPAPDCATAGFNCIPLIIGEGVPQGDVLFNRTVLQIRNDPMRLILSEPGIHMPGTYETD